MVYKIIHSELRILQNNLHKSEERTHAILSDPDMKAYGILMLQEQYWSPRTKSSPLHHSWTLTEAPTLNNPQPRAVIYTNNNLIPPSQITPLALPFSDAVAIAIATDAGRPSLFVNVYNPCDKSLINELHEYIHQNINIQDYQNIIIAGDFNTHHPLWNPPGYARHDGEADTLVTMMADLGLNLLLPAGTVTYPDAGTTIDLIWGNDRAENNVLMCKIATEHDYGSDHLPIETWLELSVTTQFQAATPPYNYAMTDWNALRVNLLQYLPPIIPATMTTRHKVDKFTEQLVDAISRALDETTPRKRPCPHSKRWWNEEITKLHRKANHLRNIYLKTRANEDKVAWREKDNELNDKIAQAKRDKWREYVENADGKSVFQIKNYITNLPTPTFIPTLNKQAATHDQKTALLQKTFFPQPPPAKLYDITNADYPEEVPCTLQISLNQVREAVGKLSPDKAPGPDEISNRLLKNTLPIIEKHLQALMQASINLAHFPKPFKHTTTIVLRKPGKPDYTEAKAYRPIALENTLGKVMESIMADVISYLTEEYQLLPPQHYGGRPGRNTEDAMMVLAETIHKAWRENDIFTAVFLDVAGAFNNVHHKRLIHNLRKRHIPKQVAAWISSFLTGRSTQLLFNGAKSHDISTPAGVPQGSPLSPLLYMYYNADLLDIPKQKGTSLGYIDDTTFGVQGPSDTHNIRKLKPILKEAEEWRVKHGVQFEPTKYILVHFTRNRKRPTEATLRINDTTVKPSEEAKYLGVIFDQELRYKSHLQRLTRKGTAAALALSSIAKGSTGMHFRYVRQLFQAVISASTDYGAVVWHRPRQDGTAASTAQMKNLTTIQRLAMIATTGCYRTTPTAALEIESDLQPAWIRLQTKVLLAVTRMQSLSSLHPIHEWILRALRTRTSSIRHRSNLEHVFQHFPQLTAEIETIEPFIRPPWWTSRIQIQIAEDKDSAKKQHEHITAEMANALPIYTDGSGIEGKIGAAACGGHRTGTQHLGNDKQFNVYAAELTAMNLAVELAEENVEHTTWHIFADSQAAIRGIQKPRKQSGQSIIKEFLDMTDRATEENPQLQIRMTWIPGHANIEGNEQADEEAKKAAIDPTVGRRFKYKPLKSARIRQIKAEAKQQWSNMWNNNVRTAHGLRRSMKTRGFKTGSKFYNHITSRKTAATLTRLRTGHCGLKQYLYRFKRADSPYCDCGDGKETVEHYLLECTLHREARNILRRNVGAGKMRVPSLLGQPKLIKHTMEFITSTKGMQI